MKKRNFLTALATASLISVAPATAQSMDSDMAEEGSEMAQDAVVDGPTTSPSPIPPAQPGTEAPKVMDNARPDNPVDNNMPADNSMSARAEQKADYPICTKDIKDSCINPYAAGKKWGNKPLSYWPEDKK